MKFTTVFAIAGGLFALSATAPAWAIEKPIDFVTKAGQGDMMEVQLGKLALRKSKNPEVRKFAQRMVSDHTKSGAQLKLVAHEAHIRAPLKLDKDHRDKIDDFAKKGDSFDRDYINFMADDHSDDVAEYDDFAKNGEEPHLKTFAGKTLPTLIQHKDMVDGIKKTM